MIYLKFNILVTDSSVVWNNDPRITSRSSNNPYLFEIHLQKIHNIYPDFTKYTARLAFITKNHSCFVLIGDFRLFGETTMRLKQKVQHVIVSIFYRWFHICKTHLFNSTVKTHFHYNGCCASNLYTCRQFGIGKNNKCNLVACAKSYL